MVKKQLKRMYSLQKSTMSTVFFIQLRTRAKHKVRKSQKIGKQVTGKNSNDQKDKVKQLTSHKTIVENSTEIKSNPSRETRSTSKSGQTNK
jgi:hypothetical protein